MHFFIFIYLFIFFFRFSITYSNFSVSFNFVISFYFQETILTAKVCTDFFSLVAFDIKFSKSFSSCEHSFCRSSFITCFSWYPAKLCIILLFKHLGLFLLVFLISFLLCFIYSSWSVFAFLSQELWGQLLIVVTKSEMCWRRTCKLYIISSPGRVTD